MIDKTVTRSSTGQRGGVIGWLVTSFFLVTLAMLIGGIFLAHTIKIHGSGNGGDVQVETPLGSVHVRNNQAAGMPVYPGARALKDKHSAEVDLSSVLGDTDLHIVAGKWETSDPIRQVEKYYEDKFPGMNVIQHGGRVEMHSVNGRSKRVIALYDRGGVTEIALASIGEPKAN